VAGSCKCGDEPSGSGAKQLAESEDVSARVALLM
jgi:hypothetical protein